MNKYFYSCFLITSLWNNAFKILYNYVTMEIRAIFFISRLADTLSTNENVQTFLNFHSNLNVSEAKKLLN